jgi:hypothetical protein
MSEIIYLKHPVSPEDKAKYRSEGFRIIDERFKPVEVEAEKPKRKRKAK